MVIAIGITLGVLFVVGLCVFFGMMYSSAKKDARHLIDIDERDPKIIQRAIDSMKLYSDAESKELMQQLMYLKDRAI